MRGQRGRFGVVLLALGLGLHAVRLDEPRRVVFDEVHFASYASAYLGSRGYVFDVHPPHAKLVIAGVAWLSGYRGGQAFATLDDPIEDPAALRLRLAPALAGSFLPLLLFGLLLQLGARPPAAFLGGLAVALDNALLLQTRIVALDGILLLVSLGSLSAVLAALSATRPGRRAALGLAAGMLAGLAAGAKFTGLAALALAAASIGASVLPKPSWRGLARAASLGACVVVGAVVSYGAGWIVHFALLTEPGPGTLWGAPTGELWRDVVRVHEQMLGSNYGLAATHPYASPWWSWPWMARPVFYWTHGDAALYFLGNPALWWGTALGPLLLLADGARGVLTNGARRLPGRTAWPPRLWIPLLGCAISLLPLVAVARVLFLYHYLPALLFALCAVVLWLDHAGWTRRGAWREQRASVHGAAAALGLGFLAISPFTFAFLEVPAYRELVFGLFPGWR